MSKLISLKIDVTKLDKSRFFQGAKGTYCDLDVWINDEEDQYGYHASVNQTQTEEEREAKEKKIYVGNGKKVFGWDDQIQAPAPQAQQQSAPADDSDDIPF